MPFLIWDASALIKRYAVELGRDMVNALFDNVPRTQMLGSFWGYVETYSILVRKRNDGRLPHADFTQAVSALRLEVLESNEFGLLSIDDETALNSIPLIVAHSLNCADAAFLTVCLEFASDLGPGVGAVTLVASDRRLLRAARSEGMATFSPETATAAELASLLSTF